MKRRNVRLVALTIPSIAVVALGLNFGCQGQAEHTYFDDLVDGSADRTATAPTEASSEIDATASDVDVAAGDGGGIAVDAGGQDAEAINDAGSDVESDGDAGALVDALAMDATFDASVVEAGCGSTTTVTHCGSCGTSCDTAHSVPSTCTGGTCEYSSCANGWGDCAKAAPNTNGCETALNTTANCTACGASCDTQHSLGAGCGAAGCTYTGCQSGWSMCSTTAPNTAGCACNTPSCCPEAGACQTTHNDGFGHSFYDCSPLNTWDDRSAREACAAYTGDINACTDSLQCTRTYGPYVCNGALNGNCDTCWSYGGGDIGKVANCDCPGTYLGTWN